MTNSHEHTVKRAQRAECNNRKAGATDATQGAAKVLMQQYVVFGRLHSRRRRARGGKNTIAIQIQPLNYITSAAPCITSTIQVLAWLPAPYIRSNTPPQLYVQRYTRVAKYFQTTLDQPSSLKNSSNISSSYSSIGIGSSSIQLMSTIPSYTWKCSNTCYRSTFVKLSTTILLVSVYITSILLYIYS